VTTPVKKTRVEAFLGVPSSNNNEQPQTVKMNFTTNNFMHKRHRGIDQNSVFKSRTQEPLISNSIQAASHASEIKKKKAS